MKKLKNTESAQLWGKVVKDEKEEEGEEEEGWRFLTH